MKKIIAGSVLFSLFVLAACHKNDMDIDTGNNPAKEYASVADFYAHNQAASQLYTIDAASGGTIYGQRGTKISFGPHSFVHQNGSAVTGNVTIELRELPDLKTMLLSNMSTMADGAPLHTGGEFYLKAYEGNNELQMAPYKTYKATLPVANPDPSMIAYVGLPDSANRINWTPADTTTFQDSSFVNYPPYYATVYDSASNYVWNSDWLGWCNSDAPYFNTTYTTFTATGTDNVGDFGTQVFLIFSGTMIHVYEDYSATQTFPYPYAPLGYNGTLVAFGVQDSTLYSAFVPVTITANGNVTFTIQPTTTADFAAALDALN